MTQKIIPLKLIFRTIKDGDKTYCGVKNDGKHLPHRFENERNRNGHAPGYVYLAYLPKGEYKGYYKIGKAEETKILIDDFNVGKINLQLLQRLHNPLNDFHPPKKISEETYNGAQFIHGIRVACAEGAEKQPHSFFRAKKLAKVDREIFDLSEDDIEAFMNATGTVLGRRIKHLNADQFADYLKTYQGLTDSMVRERILLNS